MAGEAVMGRYILQRLLSSALTIWFIATATFFAMHAVPGDPLQNEKAVSPEIRRNLEIRYGFDKPLHQQYFLFIGNMLQGDFGISFTQQNRRVNDIIREHFPVSATLGLLALFFAGIGGVIWGAIAAVWNNRWPDYLLMFLVICGISVPGFVIAALAQLGILHLNELFSRQILPVAGWEMFNLRYMVIPALVLSFATLAYIARLMRSSLLEVSNADYIKTARAKGLTPLQIFFRHQLRNAVLPIITVLGPSITAVTTGGFVVELVFAIPGLGRYFVEAVAQLDYTVIMGTTVFYGSFLVIMVMCVDILYGWADPRIRLAAKS
jgi:ABC-type dipeptide/oligopeptide/nickel transport system permease component